MWECPECHRSFRNANQSHSCFSISVEEFLLKSSQLAVNLYHQLENRLKEEGLSYRQEAVKNAIYFVHKERSLAVKFYKKSLEIDIRSSYEIKEFPVVKSIQYAKNRWWNILRIYEKEELTNSLISWIKDAY